MSMPTFPDNVVDLTEEQAFNMLLGSIAMEELSLSHILNAEGEKLQYILGTLPGGTSVCATVQELLEVNHSITELLENVAHNQLLLKGKLQQVLHAKERWCPLPTPKPCPPGGNCSHCRSCVFICEKHLWKCGQRLPWRMIYGQGSGVYIQGCSPSSLIYLNPCCVYQITCSFKLVSSHAGEDIAAALKGECGSNGEVMVCRGKSMGKSEPTYLSGVTIVPTAENRSYKSPLAFVLKEPETAAVERALLTLTLL